ncbi:DUF2975 domain-containing protein [Micrococcus endophyticus]|nr:DUF2975 domain-containing protein [Micrococcus endophyticus]
MARHGPGDRRPGLRPGGPGRHHPPARPHSHRPHLHARALPWVDAIIAAFVGGGLTCAATIAYQATAVSGPPLWSLMLLVGTAAGLGLALLMGVMRSLLTRATALRDEMDAVI